MDELPEFRRNVMEVLRQSLNILDQDEYYKMTYENRDGRLVATLTPLYYS